MRAEADHAREDVGAAHAKLRAIADEHAALRRMAALVARGAPPSAVFAAVAAEAGRLLAADVTILGRYGPAGEVTTIGAWSRTGRSPRRTAVGPHSKAAAAVSIDGRPWGVLIAASRRGTLLPAGTQARLGGFAELAAPAIATAGAHAELTASRARIVTTADQVRRLIERDLHDGAQQRLVALALQLQTARAAVPPELAGLKAELGRVATGLSDTLEELREYARGIHPAILAQGGLTAALRALARRSPLPVTLNVQPTGRLPEPVEITAYYVVSEALANAAKHARASAVRVAVDVAAGVLRVAVSDDGVGGADLGRGSGLTGLKDRVAAAGGTLTVHSRPGHGTHLVAELPVGAGPSACSDVVPGRRDGTTPSSRTAAVNGPPPGHYPVCRPG
jgi:signal transduction histidine kinase